VAECRKTPFQSFLDQEAQDQPGDILSTKVHVSVEVIWLEIFHITPPARGLASSRSLTALPDRIR